MTADEANVRSMCAELGWAMQCMRSGNFVAAGVHLGTACADMREVHEPAIRAHANALCMAAVRACLKVGR